MQKPLDLFSATHGDLEDYLNEWDLDRYYAEMYMAWDEHDEKALVRAAHNAWFALPDKPAIRSEGFFMLCDIAEYIFDHDK